MFRRISTFLAAIALIVFTAISTPLSGQVEQLNIGVLKENTHASFESGDFDEALKGFTVLSGKYQEEVMYKYYIGVCMVKLNRNLDEAVEHLYYASSRGVPEDSYYYLGLAYHNGYNFSEAEKFFKKFEKVSTRTQGKELDIKHSIRTSQSAAEITNYYNPFDVLNIAFIDLYDSTQFSQVKMRAGILSRKPDNFFKAGEDRTGLNSLMFMPEKVEKGEYIYFTGYSGTGKEGSQLFRAMKRNFSIWSDPELIKALNTEGDELLPYFDPIGNDLYFASNGRDGIGGFDLFESHFDSERNEWSEPMNLGFPVNSVMNDYLLLPGSDLGMVMFFSDRQSVDSMVTVYRVLLKEPKQYVSASDTRMIKNIAMLGGAAETMMADVESVEETPGDDTGDELMAENVMQDDQIDPVAGNPLDQKTSYQHTLTRALRYQASADSLSQLATGARIKVRESDDPNDRWVWQKQIMVWEKKARDNQLKADEMYAVMYEGNDPEPVMHHPETIEVDTVINDITVYKYTNISEPGTKIPEKSETKVPEKSEIKISEKSKINDPEPYKPAPEERVSRFEILSSSPYSESNPIPIDVVLPAGVFYRIQFGAFGKAIDQALFGGLSPVTGELVPERDLTRYYVGKFNHYSDASDALQRVKNNGYPDAFIVAYYNGQRTSTTKAQALEE